MTQPIDDLVGVEFVANADTPPALAPFAGTIVGIPSALAAQFFADLGSGPQNPGRLMTFSGQPVHGYHLAGGATGHQWVMTGPIPAAVLAQLDAIPGALGWARPASRTTFVTAGRQLRRDFDVPVPDVVALLEQLYTAAALNRDAQLAAGG